MPENNYISKTTSILIFIIALTTLIFSIFQQNNNEKKEKQYVDSLSQKININIKESIQQQPAEYLDYNSLKTLDSVIILNDFISYSPKKNDSDKKSVPANNYIPTKYEKYLVVKKKGKITKGYLEIYVSIKNKPLTTWESIYFKVLSPDGLKKTKYKKQGGHIFRPESLKVPPDSITHLLFALNRIPYLQEIPYSENKKPKYFDLFDIINNYDDFRIITFMSSFTKAKINSIKLFYESDPNYNNGKCEFEVSNRYNTTKTK